MSKQVHAFFADVTPRIPDLAVDSSHFDDKVRADLLLKQTRAVYQLIDGYLTSKNRIEESPPRPSKVRASLAVVTQQPKTNIGLAFNTYKRVSKLLGKTHENLKTSSAEDTIIVVMKDWLAVEVSHNINYYGTVVGLAERIPSYIQIMTKIAESLPVLGRGALEDITSNVLHATISDCVGVVRHDNALLTKEDHTCIRHRDCTVLVWGNLHQVKHGR